MLFTEEELGTCFFKTAEITERYLRVCLAPLDPQRSVDNLRDACQAHLGKRISFKELELRREDSAVWGARLVVPDGFDICYVQNLNHCWKRFVVCKELFHVVLDDSDSWNMDLDGHISEVTVSFPEPLSSPGPSVKAEFLAEMGAMEFLFPFAFRQRELQGPHQGNFLEIAQKYRVPQVLIERYLSGDYMKALGSYVHPRAQHPPVA